MSLVVGRKAIATILLNMRITYPKQMRFDNTNRIRERITTLFQQPTC